jgi:hypothetical protein
MCFTAQLLDFLDDEEGYSERHPTKGHVRHAHGRDKVVLQALHSGGDTCEQVSFGMTTHWSGS